MACRLYGDYESLLICRTVDALVDFTGGVAEKMFLSEMQLTDPDVTASIFSDLIDAFDNKSFITCEIQVRKKT